MRITQNYVYVTCAPFLMESSYVNFNKFHCQNSSKIDRATLLGDCQDQRNSAINIDINRETGIHYIVYA